MAITNGYDETVVLTALNRLGWINPTQEGYDIVDSDNQESASGRYYNDNSFHTSLTVQNILDCQSDSEINTDDFNCYLNAQLRKPVALSALNSVFSAPQFIESGLVYSKYERSASQLVGNEGKFCGLRFEIAPDYSLMLNNAVLLFNQAKTFKIYLFNEFIGKVKEWSVTVEANKQKILSLSQAIQYASATNKGGSWFLGYFQDDLGTAQAIDYSPRYNCYKAFGVKSISADVTGVEQFDTEQYGSGYNSFGLNVEVSAYRDLTNKIVNNAHLFDELQGLMMAAKVIELICNTTRSNAIERIGRENQNALAVQLKGYQNQATGKWVTGLEWKIKKEAERVRSQFFSKPKATVIG